MVNNYKQSIKHKTAKRIIKLISKSHVRQQRLALVFWNEQDDMSPLHYNRVFICQEFSSLFIFKLNLLGLTLVKNGLPVLLHCFIYTIVCMSNLKNGENLFMIFTYSTLK